MSMKVSGNGFPVLDSFIPDGSLWWLGNLRCTILSVISSDEGRCPNSLVKTPVTDENSYSNGVLQMPWCSGLRSIYAIAAMV